MPNRTPEADISRFEKYIEDMPDMEFEEKMDLPQSEGGFSSRQKELFSQMREVLDEDKIDILEERGFDIGYDEPRRIVRKDALRFWD